MTDTLSLSPKFRHIRLELAREKGHPYGDKNDGYDLLAPLDAEGRLDPVEWKSHRKACRVRRFRPGSNDSVGLLQRKPGGQWYFDYAEGEADDESGFRFGDERFVVGEYVSVMHGKETHTFQVVSVERP